MLSIILPVYNGSQYLRQSIESILRQTHHDFEFVIWDDGSNDDSREIIQTFKDGRIVFRQNRSNLGLFQTLTLAIDAASYDRVRLWAQDDVMMPECLEKEAKYFSGMQGWGIGYCYYHVIDGEGRITLRRPETREARLIPPDWVAEIMFFHGSLTGNISNMTFRRDVFREVGGFSPGFRYAGDFDLIERISIRYPICCIYEPLVYLRAHSGQFSRHSGAYLDSMREGADVAQRLRQRINLPQGYASRYEAWSRGVQDAHYAFRCALSGDFSTSLQAYRELSRQGRLTSSVLWWLITLNRRFYAMRCNYSPAVAQHMQWEPKWIAGSP